MRVSSVKDHEKHDVLSWAPRHMPITQKAEAEHHKFKAPLYHIID